MATEKFFVADKKGAAMGKAATSADIIQKFTEVEKLIDRLTTGANRKDWLRELRIAQRNGDVLEMERIANDLRIAFRPIFWPMRARNARR